MFSSSRAAASAPHLSSATSHRVGQHSPLLDVRDLTVRYLTPRGPVRAVDGVSFSIAPGEVFGLAGGSGSGKSTLAHALLRLLHPPAVITGGQVLFDGADVLDMSDDELNRFHWSQVSIAFQSAMNALNPVITVGEQIADVLGEHQRLGKRAAHERAAFLLDLVGIEKSRIDSYPHQLSGGQRQRVAVARALAVDPEVILADEPISMLDVSIRMGVLNLLERLKAERGIGYLYITHDIASARYIGDTTMVMYAGHLVEGAESDELMHNLAHPYTKLLLSAVPNPHANLSTRRVTARSEIPSLVDPAQGCPFAARCSHVMAICRKEMPGPEQVAPSHWVRCHLYGPGQSVPIQLGSTSR